MYFKVMELVHVLANKDKLDDSALMVGGFHIIMNFLSAVGKVIVDLGLEQPSQTSMRIYGGISGDHLCGNFLMISLRKFRGSEGEFSLFWIFQPPSPVESLEIFPRGNFPRASLKHFKMQFNDIGRVPVIRKYPSDDLMSFFGELKYLQVWGNFPLISTPS